MNSTRTTLQAALTSIARDLDATFGDTYTLRHPAIVSSIVAELISLMGVDGALAPAPVSPRVHPVIRKASTSSTAAVSVSYVSTEAL